MAQDRQGLFLYAGCSSLPAGVEVGDPLRSRLLWVCKSSKARRALRRQRGGREKQLEISYLQYTDAAAPSPPPHPVIKH